MISLVWTVTGSIHCQVVVVVVVVAMVVVLVVVLVVSQFYCENCQQSPPRLRTLSGWTEISICGALRV